ncbi:MAG: hypothetical protein GX825_00715, partial [Syntrophomonadaceae bacterium]|nr:hypothetical protein [Syntrophomonadaceae bacterium]
MDSTIGLDDEVSFPYTPVQVNGHTVSVLGRDIKFNSTGLPESVICFGNELLADPCKLVIESSKGQINWGEGTIHQTAKIPAYVSMTSENTASDLEFNSDWKVEYDGCISLSMRLKAAKSIDLKNIRIEIPFKREHAVYKMGYKGRGGYRPSGDLTGLDKMVWLGSVKAGMQCDFTGELWDQKTAEYGIQESGEAVILYANSGPASIEAGEEMQISMIFLPTPLKTLDHDHWDWRYHQVWKGVMKPEDAEKQGVGILSVHHANELNPYINYPFLTTDKLNSYANDAHSRGMKVKYYYTLRELTCYAVELWAFRAVEPNMFPNKNKRGGSSWLQEHVFSDYDRAWHSWSVNTDITDAAIFTTGNSRLMNYYLEGLYWLAMNSGDDGLYIDGLAYDRAGMQRVRKALDKAKPGAVIDFHCGRLGASNANIFLKHFPYVSSIWFGEGFNYGDKPDYWMVEISGIPYGLFGEMLGTGNPWRGMLYGMSNRLGWGGDPRFIWKVWDEFGIKNSEMIGYWKEDCPVKTGRDDVLATVYTKKDKALISLGSWADEPVDVQLAIDWQKLGLKPGKLIAPEIKGFQEE